MRISDWSSDVCSSDLFEPGGQASGGADVAGGLDLELVGRQSLHADRGPVAVAAGGIRVVAQADRAIPPRPGGMAPEQFGAGVLQLAVAAFALAAQPELVEVAADAGRSEEHTSELQSLMRISSAVFCL